MTGLDSAVKQNTRVTGTCDVRRVKPKADIYSRNWWLTAERNSSESAAKYRTFHLRATYKVSFSRNEHNAQLYCLVTQPGHKDVVWGTAHKTISVNCEYQYILYE